jgi:uncharacterized membrane protein (DUF2068 family)
MAQNHSYLFLRLIIIEKAFLALLALVLSAGILTLGNTEIQEWIVYVSKIFNLDADNRFIILLMNFLTDAQASTLVGVSVVGFFYAGLNFVEAYGLAKRYRWAEYLTVAATGLFIPFEIYKVLDELTPLRLWALVINILIVIFLAKHKELFPKRLVFFK